MLSLELPWPPRTLHPNARVHYHAKARAVKKARADAGWRAKVAGLRPMRAEALDVTVTFHAPSRRHFDDDGALSACKAYFDGIADAIEVDDNLWTFTPRRGEPRPPHGAVRIDIREIA